MTPREFQTWVAFYGQSPFDDYHRFHRPAAVIARSMCGGDIQTYIDQLVPPKPVSEVAAGELSSADIATLKAFGIKPS